MFSSEFNFPSAHDVEAYGAHPPFFVSDRVNLLPPPQQVTQPYYHYESASDDCLSEKHVPLGYFAQTRVPFHSSRTIGSVVPEPVVERYDTLTESFFKFGFVFPFLWLAGALVLRMPLTVDPNLPCHWMTNKTDGEKAAFLTGMREAELFWARRCLKAWCIFCAILVVALLIALCILLVRRH